MSRAPYTLCVILSFAILFYVFSVTHWSNPEWTTEPVVEVCTCVTKYWHLPHRENPSFEHCARECPEWYVSRICKTPRWTDGVMWKHRFDFGDLNSVRKMEIADSARGGIWPHTCFIYYNSSGYPEDGFVVDTDSEEGSLYYPNTHYWDGVLTIGLITSFVAICFCFGLKKRYTGIVPDSNNNNPNQPQPPLVENPDNIASYNTFPFPHPQNPYPPNQPYNLGFIPIPQAPVPPPPSSAPYSLASYAVDPRMTNVITSYPIAHDGK